MYGTQVPTQFAAGLPGTIAAPAVAWHTDNLMWLVWAVLLVATLVALSATLLRLVPRRGV